MFSAGWTAENVRAFSRLGLQYYLQLPSQCLFVARNNALAHLGARLGVLTSHIGS